MGNYDVVGKILNREVIVLEKRDEEGKEVILQDIYMNEAGRFIKRVYSDTDGKIKYNEEVPDSVAINLFNDLMTD